MAVFGGKGGRNLGVTGNQGGHLNIYRNVPTGGPPGKTFPNPLRVTQPNPRISGEGFPGLAYLRAICFV